MSSLDQHRYDHLTWPEINDAAEAEKVILLPIGSTEQHGHHLPLDVDNFLAMVPKQDVRFANRPTVAASSGTSRHTDWSA